MNTDTRNQSEWDNLDNWSHEKFGVYFSKRDTRLWVPKRFGLGWTLNMGHPHSGWWIVGLFGLVAVMGRLKR